MRQLSFADYVLKANKQRSEKARKPGKVLEGLEKGNSRGAIYRGIPAKMEENFAGPS